MPGNCPGEFQLEIVDGDSPGELSSLIECAVELWPIVEAVFGTMSIPSGSFFRWPKCFSSMVSKPSLVKGFGNTSFIPMILSVKSQEQILFYRPCWKYMEMSSLRIFEVIATIGVVSNWRIRWHAETPSRLGIIISINTRSYLDPAFILFTASRPSNYHGLVFLTQESTPNLPRYQSHNERNKGTCFQFVDR